MTGPLRSICPACRRSRAWLVDERRCTACDYSLPVPECRICGDSGEIELRLRGEPHGTIPCGCVSAVTG